MEGEVLNGIGGPQVNSTPIRKRGGGGAAEKVSVLLKGSIHSREHTQKVPR